MGKEVAIILLQFSSSGTIYQHGCCVVPGNLGLEGQSDKYTSVVCVPVNAVSVYRNVFKLNS